MKVHLMFKDRDFDPDQPLPANEQDLVQDLELDTLFKAMALGSKFLYAVAQVAMLTSLNKPEEIIYRQDVLKDCLNNAEIVRQIYQIPIEASGNKKKFWLGIFARTPNGVLLSSLDMMKMFVGLLRRLKAIADEHSDKFKSTGFTTFFAMIQSELSDDYFDVVEAQLEQLAFRDGVLISAELGQGNESTNDVLRLPNQREDQGWIKEIFSRKPPVYSFHIHPRDNAGLRALSDIKDRGVNLVANALAQAADHIDNFLKTLQTELAFYIGCLNLYERLTQLGAPISFPIPERTGRSKHAFQGLYDVGLALTMGQRIIGNDINADDRLLVIITGANQGGKSTFLRSIGLAQLMMQSGMFVSAVEFRASISTGVFTHFKRKEDASMKSGKLDEELGRMSGIVDQLSPNALMLFNESFAATNEREGSEIAGQISRALVERQIKVFFVTHMFEFAHTFYEQGAANALFLRAERNPDGTRTFKLREGGPLPTSHGKDIYETVFDKQSDPMRSATTAPAF
ncbi:MAG: DNA mismatch repair protein MutS [Chloroflexota bacterium]